MNVSAGKADILVTENNERKVAIGVRSNRPLICLQQISRVSLPWIRSNPITLQWPSSYQGFPVHHCSKIIFIAINWSCFFLPYFPLCFRVVFFPRNNFSDFFQLLLCFPYCFLPTDASDVSVLQDGMGNFFSKYFLWRLRESVHTILKTRVSNVIPKGNTEK